jgi:tRNA pseudouridine38-40 synthase
MEAMIWKTILSYDGADFHGWQIQPGLATVQGALAEAVLAVTGERVLPQGAGRTDAGVHALGQVASFSIRAPIPPENLLRALNRVLPPSIRVLRAEIAPPGFHARHSALGKIYRYRLLAGGTCPPFLARYAACCRWPLNLDAMQVAAQAIVGEHDFSAFAASDPDRSEKKQRASSPEPDRTNIRCVQCSGWSQEAFEPQFFEEQSTEAQLFTYTVYGNGFLHHMVRNLVGTFLEVGRGRLKSSAMADILASRDRARAGPTAPAEGLYLIEVLY